MPRSLTYVALLTLFFLISSQSYSQDTLKVHFLYGSKPLKRYKATETKWFGGMLGGHVGIEGDSGLILNFVPRGRFHWFTKNNNKHSIYTIYSFDRFYSVMGGDPDSNKKAIVYIPVTPQQKQKFDSISTAYLKVTPYDYALFGMRCGAATYDILGQLGILPAYCHSRTWKKILYPKKLRKRLLKKGRGQWLENSQTGRLRQKEMGKGLSSPAGHVPLSTSAMGQAIPISNSSPGWPMLP